MKSKLTNLIFLFLSAFTFSISSSAKIDRPALLQRNSPVVNSFDTLASLSVGNGEFAFTCDVTGLQTFPQLYSHGVPLGTMAQWGWHSFPNTENYTPSDVLKAYDFGRGAQEWYSCQFKQGREKSASDYLRANPHRLHLGYIGFTDFNQQKVKQIKQCLNLYDGIINSSFLYEGKKIGVTTSCHPHQDMVSASIEDAKRHTVTIRFAYPTGQHSDDASDWTKTHLQHVTLLASQCNCCVYKRELDAQCYYIKVHTANAVQKLKSNEIILSPSANSWSLSVEFTAEQPDTLSPDIEASMSATKDYWHTYWNQGGMVDFSKCTDPRAKELERRVVLSQYLTAIQCTGSTPPQETGLTYNSWFGKFHLEMTWWHQAHFPLWGHPEMLARTLPWYKTAADKAREVAQRQGLQGVRWMKMTDPSAEEAPSNVGSFLIWQQPHIIYMCELLYRSTHSQQVLSDYADIIDQTAQMMASYVTYDSIAHRYTLRGCIPAQETLKAAETVNPPFELSYWHFGLSIAQQWRERLGQSRNAQWDDIIQHLSPLCEKDGVYAAAETADSYNDPQHPAPLALYSDHMAVLAACGVLPYSPQYSLPAMSRTLHWVMDHWNWDKTWGWDYPTTCMNAVRLGEPDIAIDALLMDKRTNTYLPNGHNYQDDRLRCYLPGNGGLLTAVALMCAGWDGCTTTLPGFPKDGKWNVVYEGIEKMP